MKINQSFPLDYDTDEETDKLLGIEHRMHAKNQAIRDAVSPSMEIDHLDRLRFFVVLGHVQTSTKD